MDWPLVIVFLIGYVGQSLPIYVVAQKLDAEASWQAWVPILNLYLLSSLSEHTGAGCLLFIVPIVNWVWFGYLWAEVAEMVHQPRPLGWLAAIPILGAIPSCTVAFRARPRLEQSGIA